MQKFSLIMLINQLILLIIFHAALLSLFVGGSSMDCWSVRVLFTSVNN